MKIVGFVTEYNPFHYGHKYHLQESISKTKATHSLAIMSSSFVQRGEPSIVDKWTKAKMAIDNGVDLVIELPFIYSTQSAELFALGSINIMNSLNIVDYLSFGSEINDLKPLEEIARILLNEPNEYRESLKKHLSKGLSFPKARSLALTDYLYSIDKNPIYDYEAILKQSNNILGIEYLKALKKLNSNITPITIPRQGSDYKEERLSKTYASATSIRNSILETGLDSIKDFVPEASFNSLLEYKNKYKRFNTLENYETILRYLLIMKKDYEIRKFLDVEGGLENRIIQKASLSKNISDLVDNIATKRYPKTRIQRILIHILNDLKKDTIKELYKYKAPYIRILGASEKGYEILKTIKKNSNIPIINKFSDYRKLNNKIIDKFINYEEKATDLYFLGLNLENPLVKMDYIISQYNKKN